MRESRTYGSVRGALSNGCPYRIRQMGNGFEALSETGPIGYRRRGLIRAVADFAEYPD